jgi:hypothetical protein
MRRVHGTHVYTFLACPRAVALDMHGDPSAKRPLRDGEQLALARGREHEARVVAGLDYAAPEYPRGDFAAGARATAALLQAGVGGVHQGVLLSGHRLGVPDLLRREPGASAFGAHHYVVGDVKSSRRIRGDQILQVAFYARLLADLQQRAPEYGFLILKDGREERLRLAEYDAVLDDVLGRVEAIAAGAARPEDLRPFLARACRTCAWSELCRAELEAADDPSLVAGMTRGMRRVLAAAGLSTAAALAQLPVERVARSSGIERRLLERIRLAAQARRDGRSVALELPAEAQAPPILLHALVDPFADRLLWLGALDRRTGESRELLPRDTGEAIDGMLAIAVAAGAEPATLGHFGGALPRWYDRVAHEAERLPLLDAQFVDLEPRLRAAFVPPGPIDGLGGWVRAVLGREPADPRDADAAPLWLGTADGEQRLRAKGAADLRDLVALLDAIRHRRG